MNYIFAAAIIAFAVCAVCGPFVIPWLKRLKFGNTEREEGVASHLKKQGTPTMGGIMILLGILVAWLVFVRFDTRLGLAFILTFGFGVIGFLDDFLKSVKKKSDGLIAWQKLLLEAAVAVIFLVVFMNSGENALSIRLPFTGGKYADIGVFGIILYFIVVLAVVNGVNFTDGLDGLASGVTSVVAAFFIGASILLGQAGLGIGAGAVLGALMGFLLFNSYPAKVFMGDTGSLALGGFVAAYAYIMHIPLHILLFGLIYAIELLSVAMQVSYFKLTHGKRIFKMTPIHHHFELCGWSETRIVATFTIITIITSMLALMGL